MNRFRLDCDTQFMNDQDNDEGNYERQALISDDELTCDAEMLSSKGPISRRSNSKQIVEMQSIPSSKETMSDAIGDFIYYDIKPEDSLQSICLRFACPVNRVKRLNGLMTDQEFYALRRIKLPLGKLGLLEEVIKSQRSHPDDLIVMEDNNDSEQSAQNNRFSTNSPGSALSIATSSRNSHRFKPLLSPGYSSDNISHIHALDTTNGLDDKIKKFRDSNLHQNSHSFSSLRDFDRNDDKIVDSQHTSNRYNHKKSVVSSDMRATNFIKPNMTSSMDDAQITIDAILNDTEHVPNVFEDLDYHVGKAKEAAENYDRRAAELANRIDINSAEATVVGHRTRASKIPELFFTGENFGLNLTKLVALIFLICLVVPFVYMNQVNVNKRQLQ